MTLEQAIDYCERIGSSRFTKGQAQHLEIALYLKALQALLEVNEIQAKMVNDIKEVMGENE